jgi:hypothetical protein
VSSCTVHVIGSQIDLVLEGDRNKLKLTEAAGKIAIVGNENQIEVEKAWITGRVDGNMNQFVLIDSEFQLASYKGDGNHIPRIL